MTSSCTDLAEVTLIAAVWLVPGSPVRPLLAALVTPCGTSRPLLAETTCRGAGVHRRFLSRTASAPQLVTRPDATFVP
jgi:hypothetical protein